MEKYYIKFSNDECGYLNINRVSGSWLTGDKYEDTIHKTQFTEDEIDGLKDQIQQSVVLTEYKDRVFVRFDEENDYSYLNINVSNKKWCTGDKNGWFGYKTMFFENEIPELISLLNDCKVKVEEQ